MKTIAVGQIIVLSALFAQTLSAPSGCIESCNFYQTSYRNRQTSGGYQDHASLIQENTNLNEGDYAKPGNWTKHNQYDTDNGHGKVHEERGQYVEGSKRVRYYKKNFTSSYNTGNVDGVGAIELDQLTDHRRHDSAYVPSNQHLDSQNSYDQVGATSVTKESGYSRVHSQQTQSSSKRTEGQSERLEDFGEYGGHSQVNQRVSGGSQISDTNYHTETIPQNWSRVDSYKTDGGQGRIFEEEGQYVAGPKKVRYYKKNYTSSYSTSGVPQAEGSLQNLHEMQQNLHRQLDDFKREFHQTSNVGHLASRTHMNSAQSLAQETVGIHSDDLQTAESDTYRQQLTHHRAPSTGTMNHYADQQQREMVTDTRLNTPYIYPSATSGTYGTDNHRTYQAHETYVSRVHPMSQPTDSPRFTPVSPDYLQRPLIRDGYQSGSHNVHSIGHHAVDDTQRAITSSTHQSSIAQNQLFTDNSQRAYHPNPDHHGTYPSRRGQTAYHEEHWSSSSHTGGNLYPGRSMSYGAGHTERAHYDRDAYNEHLNRHRTAAQGYDSHAHTSGNTYNSAYRTSSGQLVPGSLDLGHAVQSADCAEEIQQYQQESRHHRKYKRDDHHGFVDDHQTAENDDLTQQYQKSGQESQQLEGLTQQFQEFGQQTMNNQHLEDLTQQSEQFTQQTEGSDDSTQQTSGKLEFGQQTGSNQHMEDLTQQTTGKLEFGQQTVGNQHLEDLTQQTEGSDDFTQQTSGKLEFGQQTGSNQHMEDLTQQTTGKLEFGQQTVGNQHLEDLTQQTEGSDDFTQQTSGKLEFGQQTGSNQHMEDLTQQTTGKLEFGQQTVGDQHLEDLTQQTEGSDDFAQQTSGKLEFGQQTGSNQHMEDLTQQTEQLSQRTERSYDITQQTSGKIEFGQQSVGNQHLEDLTQQTEQFGQQTEGIDDFTQQMSGKLEFGQQTEGSDDFTQQMSGKLEFGQQTEGSDDFTQQMSDKLEFGQQTTGDQHLEDLTQQNGQFGQQTEGSDDFTQQMSGKLEFGQQTEGSDDFTQQMSGKLEFGQQTVGNQHLEDLTQQTEQFGQQIEGSDDFTQQMNGKLEFGQQTEGSDDFTQQMSDKLEFGQQTTGDQHLEDLTQQNGQFGQQTEGSDDFTQQTSDKLEFGQQTIGDQHLEDLTQQTAQFGQQTEGSDDFTQQMSGKLEFGQHTVGNLKDLTQQSEQRIQQSNDKLEFGPHMQPVDKISKPKNQHMDEFNHQMKDFSQQTEGNDEFTQQTMGHLEFGQQTRLPHRSGSQHLNDFTQQNEDLTQQVGGFDDFTQQTSDKLEFGQQTVGNQHLEDLTQETAQFGQQTEGSDDFTQQMSGKLEFGQHTVGNLKDLTQQSEQRIQQLNDKLEFGPHMQPVDKISKPKNQHMDEFNHQMKDFSQQTEGNDEFTQQTMGHLEFGQQTRLPHRSGSQHLNDFTQQNEDLTQQVGGFDDFTQQTSDKLEFGQQTVGNQHLEDLTQQTAQFGQQTKGSDDFTQQMSGKLEFGQHTVGNLKDLTQQSEQRMQQSNDKLEFGPHMQPEDKISKPKNQHMDEFNHQMKDFSQQTEGNDEFTQQTMGHLEFGQQTRQPHRSGSQNLNDFTQQNEDLTQQVGGFGDFTQQTTAYLEHGQQREQQWKPGSKYDEQYSEYPSQQSEWDKELELQSRQILQKINFDQDFTQQADHNQQIARRPASKPRQQQQKLDSNPSHTVINIDDVSTPIEINSKTDILGTDRETIQYDSRGTNPKFNYHSSRIEDQQSQGNNGFDNEKENMDRLHWIHKSNDATVGLQWHYTYHPSDLTNVESSHNTYYPQYSMGSMPQYSMNPMPQQTEQQKPLDLSQRETQSKHVFGTSSFGNQFEQNSEHTPSRVIPLQDSQISQQTIQLGKQSPGMAEPKLESQIESRILEAYGNKGPYASFDDDDVYKRAKPNPSITFPPIYDKEPWIIQEIPRRRELPSYLEGTSSPINTPAINKADDLNTTELIEVTTQITETTIKEVEPSFWARFGNKITNSYGKAKEKAKEFFG